MIHMETNDRGNFVFILYNDQQHYIQNMHNIDRVIQW